ncbi:TetR/AcrR family transcriptional regulator [Virgisporangium aurantiacum]|uniref:TetR family transcriptional regulator n=1 Tax=Virgisporangium aurantiacum TaxID=175570 RepID=A0A8J3YWQ1_9ACTN|nr:TetR/AcrR family transcriptional regulator [Virgisporangium aurantiacum]GIJ53329.1 TetR family transcriptional regulator [Virgisporangium aurantiacum]
MTQVIQPPRLRLVGALASAAAEKGYAATTIADIVRHARVSKRTFYEHFADKEACLLAGYEHISGRLMDVLREVSVPSDRPWQEQVRHVTAAYLGALEELPAVNRSLLIEVQAAGAEAYRLRAGTQQRFASLLCELVAASGRSLSPVLALAIVGGINELTLHAAEARPFTELLDPVTDLVVAVVSISPPA